MNYEAITIVDINCKINEKGYEAPEENDKKQSFQIFLLSLHLSVHFDVSMKQPMIIVTRYSSMLSSYSLDFFFLFKSSHHFRFGLLYWLVTLGNMSGSPLAIEIQTSRQHQPDLCAGLLLRGIEPQHRHSQLSNNPMSHSIPIRWI